MKMKNTIKQATLIMTYHLKLHSRGKPHIHFFHLLIAIEHRKY